MPEKIYQRLEQIKALIDENSLTDAKRLTDQIETEAENYDGDEKVVCRLNVSSYLFDIGSGLKDEGMILRGIEYVKNWINSGLTKNLANDYYNLGVGYESLLKLDSVNSKWDVDPDNHLLSRHYYRLSLRCISQSPINVYLASLSWTNYGNTLSKIGRDVEAFSAYDAALKIKPDTGMALGNKGAALFYFAHLMLGYEHLLYSESRQLLQSALQLTDLTPEAQLGMENRLEEVKHVEKLHAEMKQNRAPENHKGIQPKDDFQRFLCEFSAKHELFLSPISFVGEDKQPFYGDPMFISLMFPDIRKESKVDRYISFLNEIKQDYVLGRFFLVQSQYESAIVDAVDDGVKLFRYTLDNAVYNTYAQLLKSALKQAVAVLDKVAYFLYDYCGMTKPAPDRISFLQIWGNLNNETIQKAFKDYESPYLLALFTLARDLFKEGDWNPLIEYRGIVTHRFMILHESLKADQPNSDIPRGNIENFLANTVFALQKARAAVMYLILFVNHQEISKSPHGNNIDV